MALADINGDGDLDVFVGRYNIVYLLPNTGNPTNPLFPPSPTPNPFGLTSYLFGSVYHFPDLGDLDGDGDLDVVIGMGYFGVHHFRNSGSAGAPSFFPPGVINSSGLSRYVGLTMPKLVDIEGDGDLDAFLAFGSGPIRFQRNVGSSTNALFDKPVSNPFGLSFGGFQPSFVGDIDADGDIDYFTTGGTFFKNTAPIDTTGPVPTIILDGDNPTASDTVSFYVQFNEPVGNTFTSADIVPTPLTVPASSIEVAPSPADPAYRVFVTFADPNQDGPFDFKITTAVQDIYGNSMSVAVNSDPYTITPPGDVNYSGTFDIADVALLADANLSLVTLP